MMNIFIMSAIFPREDNIQSGIYIYEQCEVLKKHGHTLTVLDASTYSIKQWSKCDKLFSYVSSVGKVYVKHTKGFMQSRFPRFAVKTYLKNAEKLFRKALKEQGKPDLIYAHFTFPCGYAAKYLSQKYGIPFAVEEHYSLFLSENLPKYLKKITKETVLAASAFFCVSQGLKESIERLTGIKNKIEVVNNLINARYTYYPPPKNDEFVFFAAGNLVKSKKFDLLIRAFAEAFQKGGARLYIAGDGAERDALMALAKEQGGKIEFLGRLSGEQMIKNYKKCNCFVLLSEYETFGIVFREAMAVGRAVIAAKCGGVEENWLDDFGILVEKNNFSQSRDALIKIVKDYDKYDPKMIAQKTKELYSEEIIYKKIEKQLEKAKLGVL